MLQLGKPEPWVSEIVESFKGAAGLRKAISSPWESVQSSPSSGAWEALPQTASPPWVTVKTGLNHQIMDPRRTTREPLKTSKRTFIHILALPAQLLNKSCRSLREKNRSRTSRTRNVQQGGSVDEESQTNHKRRLDSSALCLSFHR
jgi:hypothetical protein